MIAVREQMNPRDSLQEWISVWSWRSSPTISQSPWLKSRCVNYSRYYKQSNLYLSLFPYMFIWSISRYAAIWSSRCHVECILKTSLLQCRGRWNMGTWAKLFHFVCFLHWSASWSFRPATFRIFPQEWIAPSRITRRPREQYMDHESTASRRQPKSSSPSHANTVSKRTQSALGY